MRTYNVTFSEKDSSNNTFVYKTTKEGFRNMRAFAMMTRCKTHECYTYRFANAMDDVRDMEEGDKIFVICSAYEVHTANSIEEFNAKVARMERASREDLDEDYMPNEFSAFMVKRTAQTWRYTSLHSTLNLN